MVVRKMKEKCKDAARMRREKERAEFIELSKLLPLPTSTTSQLDKASIIRLTSSYLRMRAAFPEGLGANWGTQKFTTSFSAAPASSNCNARVASSLSSAPSPSCSFDNDVARHYHANSGLTGQNFPDQNQQQLRAQQLDQHNAQLHHQATLNKHGLPTNHPSSAPNSSIQTLQPQQQQQQQTHVKELGSLILQTLDGFVFALHRDGKIMYISETASVLLGLPQIDLTGSSIFDYIHPADHSDLLDMLGLSELDKAEIQMQLGKCSPNSSTHHQQQQPEEHLELGRSFSLRMKCILPKRNAGLIKNGYKSIHCTGYLKVKRTTDRQPYQQAPVLPARQQAGKMTVVGDQLEQKAQFYAQSPDTHKMAATKACARSATSKSYSQQATMTLTPNTPQLDWDSYALVAVGHSLLPTASTEIKLSRNSFMFRANLDMKIYYMEATALYSLGHHQQTSLAGQSLYQLVHLADVQHLEKAHRSLLSKGQVVSKYIRIMRRDTGYIWIQMQASLINNPRSMPKSLHIVAICTVIGDNHLDQSRLLLLDEQASATTTSATRQVDQSLNMQANNLHETQLESTTATAAAAAVAITNNGQQRVRNITRAHSASNNTPWLTSGNKNEAKLSNETAGGSGGGAKRNPSTSRRREKQVLPTKRMRLSNADSAAVQKYKPLGDENSLGGAGRVQLRTGQQPMISSRNSMSIDERDYNQTIGLLRRPSDDTCSVASSGVSVSSTASAISNPGSTGMMPCLTPSISSSCSSASSNCSPSSISTARACNVMLPMDGTYLPSTFDGVTQHFKQTDFMDRHIQIEHDETSFNQQLQLQQCYTMRVSSQNLVEFDQTYSNHNHYHTGNYWPIDKTHCQIEPSGISRNIQLPIPDQPPSNHTLSEQYCNSLNEQTLEINGQLVGYHQYNSDCSTPYTNHVPTTTSLKTSMNTIEGADISIPQYQYHISTYDQPDSSSLSAIPAPINVIPSTACFVGVNQSL